MSLNSFVPHRSLASARSTRLPFVAIIQPHKDRPTMYVPAATRSFAEKLLKRASILHPSCKTTLLLP